jgi:hypothetical protein
VPLCTCRQGALWPSLLAHNVWPPPIFWPKYFLAKSILPSQNFGCHSGLHPGTHTTHTPALRVVGAENEMRITFCEVPGF